MLWRALIVPAVCYLHVKEAIQIMIILPVVISTLEVP